MMRLKPTRLKLDKPLTGPYDRLLGRPGPEVMAFNSGQSTVLIRGTRLVGALPLWETVRACYYPSRGDRKGWSVEDFRPEVQAGHWATKDQVDLLAVPIGYYKLPNSSWVGQMAPVLTPWQTEVGTDRSRPRNRTRPPWPTEVGTDGSRQPSKQASKHPVHGPVPGSTVCGGFVRVQRASHHG